MFKTKYLLRINREKKEDINNKINQFFDKIKENK